MCRSPWSPLPLVSITVNDFKNEASSQDEDDGTSSAAGVQKLVMRGTFLEYSDRGRMVSRVMHEKRSASWHPCCCSTWETKCTCLSSNNFTVRRMNTCTRVACGQELKISHDVAPWSLTTPYPTMGKKRKEEEMASVDAEEIFANGPTTMMLRNYPRRRTQQQLMMEIECSGFGGTFDFLYLPFCLEKSQNNGFAFINFKTTGMAREFYKKWNKTWFPIQMRRPMTVSAADVQGLEANLRRISNEWRLKRVTNTKYKPIVFNAEGKLSSVDAMSKRTSCVQHCSGRAGGSVRHKSCARHKKATRA